MSGHSKWATIHRQKGINDAKKGAIFTKLGKAITIAVKEGRGLQLALEKAKQFNMPKDNIQRAIDRGSGVGAGEELHEVMFEGFGPGGVAILVLAVTDNKLRTAQMVHELFDRGGGKMAGQGAVRYMFSADMEPIYKVEVAEGEVRQKVEALLEKLEDLDDVQKVWTNYA